MLGLLAYVFSLLLMFGVVSFGYTKLTLASSEAPPTISANGQTTAATHTASAKPAVMGKRIGRYYRRHH